MALKNIAYSVDMYAQTHNGMSTSGQHKKWKVGTLGVQEGKLVQPVIILPIALAGQHTGWLPVISMEALPGSDPKILSPSHVILLFEKDLHRLAGIHLIMTMATYMFCRRTGKEQYRK